jgi:hypothetical protein
MMKSLAPWRSYSGGIEVSRLLYSAFRAPDSASVSAPLFPLSLLCPFIHLKEVTAMSVGYGQGLSQGSARGARGLAWASRHLDISTFACQ